MQLRSKPVLCNYYLTYRCNAKCGFCNIWEKPSPYASIEAITTNLTALKKLGVKIIDFTGGEPLLHQNIGEILRIAKDFGFITTLTTNCLLYPKKAKEIANLVDMLHFSIDFYDKEKHNKSRGVECYDHFIESIEIAKKLNQKPDILLTVFNENVEDIPKIYNDFCLANKFMLILNPVFGYDDIKDGLTTENLDKLSSYGQLKWTYLNEGFISLRKDNGNNTKDPVCKAQTSTIVISPENKLIAPCYHLGSANFNINNNLETLYHSEEINFFKKNQGRLPECEGCLVNCYMQPSFSVEVNKYFWKALPSTIKYNMRKGTWKNLFKRRN